MATLPGLQKGITKDATPPATDTQVAPITVPDGTILLTTKLHNEIVDNEDKLIDYVSGDASPDFIPQVAIATLVSDLAARELIANKGAVSGYAGLDASQKLLLTNFPSGSALQVLRRDAANTALEFATISAAGIISINADTTAAQIIAAGTGLGIVDAGATHTLSIDATVVTLTGTQTLTNKTLTTPTIVATGFTNMQHTHQAVNTGGQLVATSALTATGIKDSTTFLRGDNTWDVPAGGSSPPFDDTTALVKGSADATKLLRFEVDGGTTGITGVIATVFTTAKTITIPDATDTLMGKATTDVMTNKSYALGGIGNTLTGTAAQFDTAVTDDNFAFVSDNLSVFAATTSSQLAGVISDETGSGLLVFGTSPTIVTPTIASFLNATHTHLNAAGGGTLTAAAVTDLNSATITFTNKTIDADATGNVITNIGSSEIKSEMITGFATVTALTGDFVLISDTSDSGNLKKVNASDFLVGGSQTPWLSDVDTGGFALTFTDDPTSPAASVAFLNWSFSIMKFNVPTGDNFEFKVNDVVQMTITDSTIDLELNNLTNVNQITLRFGHTILGDSGGITFDVDTADNYDFQINSVTEMTLTATALTLGDANDLVFGTTTGTKIGTATTQKIAFWNATPVIQPSHIADPTGGGTVDSEARTAINSILAQMATTGIQASS